MASSSHYESDEFGCTSPHQISLKWSNFDCTELIGYWEQFSHDEQRQFRDKYGNLVDLIYINPPRACVEKMVEYWDPTYKCFAFGLVDMTPTIEEYQRLLGFPTTPYTPYLHDPQGNVMDKVEFLFPNFRVGNQFSRNRRGWSWNAWKVFLHNRVDPTYRLKFFGVALFGLVVFPRLPNVIDIAAVGAFYEVDNLDANPVVAILADTFLSLNKCRQNPPAPFHCCVGLLFIWMVSHVFKGDGIFNDPEYEEMGVMKIFVNKNWRSMEDGNIWEHLFQALQLYKFDWKAGWMKYDKCLISCGQYFWVPLAGIRGIIGYAPTLVLRQLGHKQYIPRTDGLEGYSFEYGSGQNSYAEEFQRVKLAWTKPYYLETLQPPSDQAIDGYKEWQLERIKNYCVPQFGGQLDFYVANGRTQDRFQKFFTDFRNLDDESPADLCDRIRELEAQLVESHNIHNLLVHELERMQKIKNPKLQRLQIENRELRNENDKLKRQPE